MKADNILRTTEGTIKIADFGVSKHIRTLQSGPKSLRGTPYWIAPEVIRSENCTNKVDIWGVGVTAFELLTGHPPFYDLAEYPAMYKIGQVKDMKDELIFPKTVNTLLKDFIFSCVEVTPEQRPSADDVLKTELFSCTT